MIDCKTALARLGLYMDGELNERTRTAMEVHLATCPGCRHELEALKAIHPVMAALTVPSPPPFLTTRIMAHARETSAGQRGFWGINIFCPWASRWMAPAALACGILIGTVMGLSNHSPLAPQPRMTCIRPGDPRADLLCSTWAPADQSSIEAATMALMEN